jgi:hypothetical protein
MTEFFNDLMPDLQVIALLVNAILVLIVFPLRKSIDNLQRSDERMFERLANLEIKIAEKYVERDEIVREVGALRRQLERIEMAVLAPKVDILRQQSRL